METLSTYVLVISLFSTAPDGRVVDLERFVHAQPSYEACDRARTRAKRAAEELGRQYLMTCRARTPNDVVTPMSSRLGDAGPAVETEI